MLKSYQEQLTKLQSVNEHLTQYIRTLPPPTPLIVSFALPDKFDCTAKTCKGFVRQIKLYFDHQSDKFATEEKKCAFLMTLLTGKAIDWASAVWDSDSRIKYSLDYFIDQIREVFEYPAGGRDISTQIINIKQGNRTAAEFAVEFRTLAAQSRWNHISLKAMSYHSLNPDLQTELTCRREDSSFSEFVSLAIKIDNLMRQAPKRKVDKGNSRSSQVFSTSRPPPQEEPMQLNNSRLSEEERERRRLHRLCYYCGESGHRSLGCPQKAQTNHRVNINHFSLLSNRTLTLPDILKNDTLSLELTAMVDSESYPQGHRGEVSNSRSTMHPSHKDQGHR
ncbi:Pol poly [Labeo rohita]|uniref:Pol poly n=1 Tax=Labeo rohita TaxID=84645 RepID=A0A498M3G1_LABRO|nr:Pol poly [Labeo rohita]